MSFEINYNTPVCGTNQDGTRTGIVCNTNLTPTFFKNAGVSSLPEGTSVHIGYGQNATTYTIEGNGPKQTVDATIQNAVQEVGKILIRRGAQPKAAA